MRDSVQLTTEESITTKRLLLDTNTPAQARIAETVGIAQGTVSNFLAGKPVSREKAIRILAAVQDLPFAQESPSYAAVDQIRERLRTRTERALSEELTPPVGPVFGFKNCLSRGISPSSLPASGFSFVTGSPQSGVSTALRTLASDDAQVRETSALLVPDPDLFLDFLWTSGSTDGSIDLRKRPLAVKINEFLVRSTVGVNKYPNLSIILDDYHLYSKADRRSFYGLFQVLNANRASLDIRGLVGVRRATWDEDTNDGNDYNPALQFSVLELKPFSLQEIQDLLARFHLNPDKAAELLTSFGGHPQKTHQAIWELRGNL